MADLINGILETTAGFMILLHCRSLYHDKKVRGVSIAATAFFAAWGFWNLYYYPSLGQSLSFWGGLFVVTTNSLWVAMLLYYKRNS